MLQYDATIIIPVFNGDRVLDRFLNSLENQRTVYKYLIILVDDGSEDKSIQVITRFKEKYNNILVIQENNLKQSAARNNGLKHVEGRYLFFFDCDDYLNDNMLESMIRKMDHGNDLVICGIEKHFADNQVFELDTVLTKNKNKTSLVYKYLTKNKEMDVGLWNKVFRIDYVKENNLSFDNANFFEDSLFVLQYLMLCNPHKIASIKIPLYHLIKHSGSTTTTFNENIDRLSYLYVNKVFKVLKQNNIERKLNIDNAFRIRTILYCVNHHIKYDRFWSKKKQISLLKMISIDKYIRGIFMLSPVYSVGSVLARFTPNIYSKLYLRRR